MTDRTTGFWQTAMQDHQNFYARRSLAMLGGGLLVGAGLANSSADRELHKNFQSSVRSASSDDWYETLHANKELGNGRYTLPLFAGAWLTGELFQDSPSAVVCGRWGQRSLRAFALGAPPMLLAQKLTGASRPGETSYDSQWRLWRDNNGVSGHSFMSAIPFISAAKMTDDPWIKSACYAGSLLGPLSRINDDAHYPSQAALGWWFAYVAVSAVDQTDDANQRFQIQPLLVNDAVGGAIGIRF